MVDVRPSAMGEPIDFEPSQQTVTIPPHIQATVRFKAVINQSELAKLVGWHGGTIREYLVSGTTAEQLFEVQGKLFTPPTNRPWLLVTGLLFLALAILCFYFGFEIRDLRARDDALSHRIAAFLEDDVVEAVPTETGPRPTSAPTEIALNDSGQQPAFASTATRTSISTPLPTSTLADSLPDTGREGGTTGISLGTDSYTVTQSLVTFVDGAGGLFVNDVRPSDVQTTAKITQQPTNGFVEIAADGGFTYAPTIGYFGPDLFIYQVCLADVQDLCESAIVTVTVERAPISLAVNDEVTVPENSQEIDLTLTLLGNDSKTSNELLDITGVDNLVSDRVRYDAQTKRVFYNPGTDFASLQLNEKATESFSYSVSDQLNNSDTAIVTITITGVNSQPIANENGPDATVQVAITAGEPLVIPASIILGVASDPDDDQLKVVAIENDGAGGNGELVNGDLVYEYGSSYRYLNDGESETDLITYQVEDPAGAQSLRSTIEITITGINDSPILTITNPLSPLVYTSTMTTGLGIANSVTILDYDNENLNQISVSFVGSGGRPDGLQEYVQFTFGDRVVKLADNPLIVTTIDLPADQFVAALQTLTYHNETVDGTGIPALTSGCRQIAVSVFDEFGLESNKQLLEVQVGTSSCAQSSESNSLIAFAAFSFQPFYEIHFPAINLRL